MAKRASFLADATTQRAAIRVEHPARDAWIASVVPTGTGGVLLFDSFVHLVGEGDPYPTFDAALSELLERVSAFRDLYESGGWQ